MSSRETLAGIVKKLSENPTKIQGLSAVFQFELDGEGGGTYHVVADNGAVTLGDGAHEKPGVTVLMTAENFDKLAKGQLNGMAAFMSGQLKIKGDMGLAMRLQSMLG